MEYAPQQEASKAAGIAAGIANQPIYMEQIRGLTWVARQIKELPTCMPIPSGTTDQLPVLVPECPLQVIGHEQLRPGWNAGTRLQ